MKEEFKELKDTGLKVSNTGKVYSIKWDRLLSQSKNYKGHLCVTYRTKFGKVKRETVETLVAKAFLPNLDFKRHIAHKDGNPLNNCVTNLEQGAKLRKLQAGRKEKQPHQKEKVVKMRKKGMSFAQIAKEMGLNESTVRTYSKQYKIQKGIVEKTPFQLKKEKIISLFVEKKKSLQEISKKVGMPVGTIRTYLNLEKISTKRKK